MIKSFVQMWEIYQLKKHDSRHKLQDRETIVSIWVFFLEKQW